MDVLEIGPGSGLFSFPIAQAVTSGRLTCVDIAPELVDALEMMLDPDYLLPSTVRRLAARAGLRETDRAGSFLTRSEKKTCGCIRKKLPTPCARLEGIYWEMENRYGAMGEEAGQ